MLLPAYSFIQNFIGGACGKLNILTVCIALFFNISYIGVS